MAEPKPGCGKSIVTVIEGKAVEATGDESRASIGSRVVVESIEYWDAEENSNIFITTRRNKPSSNITKTIKKLIN